MSTQTRGGIVWPIITALAGYAWLAAKAAILWLGLFLLVGVGVRVGIIQGFAVVFALLGVNAVVGIYLARNSALWARLWRS